MNGDSPSFRWWSDGINAFYIEEGGAYNPAKFVRFDKYGIYGVDGIISDSYKVDEPNKNGLTGEERIWEDAAYALTWKGFMLKRVGLDGGGITISS
jgi:hypothetical protein